MGLESGTYLSDLVITNPVGGTDDYATTDDHLRLIKSVLRASFPNIDGVVTPSPADLNVMLGASAAGLTPTELGYLNGVTSAIQSQLDGKAASSHNHSAANIISGQLAIAYGGTGGATAAAARTALGLAIGSDVQAYDADLAAIAALSNANGNFIVGTGSGWAAESGATARASLGLGTLATLNSVNNGNWSGTDLSVANGGTGSSNATAARAALGLAIGTDVQAYNAKLANISGLALTNGNFIVANGTAFVAYSGATARGALGLGSMAVRNITVSSSTPSGGTDGDLWFQREA